MGRYQLTYGEVADALSELGQAVKVTRRVRDLSLREVARQSGVPFTMVARIESGLGCQVATAIKLCRWLDAPKSRPLIAVEKETL
jgi:transcriptional regulator with XRE-family HTH domain